MFVCVCVFGTKHIILKKVGGDLSTQVGVVDRFDFMPKNICKFVAISLWLMEHDVLSKNGDIIYLSHLCQLVQFLLLLAGHQESYLA